MKLKLAVFFGGKSVEHEVSVITALQAIDALNTEKYEIIPVYITKENIFYTGETLLDIKEYRDISEMLRKSIRVTLTRFNNKTFLQFVPPRKLSSSFFDYIDAALLCTHGSTVEDGALQGLLKFNNIPFTGCGVAASAIGMDKFATKCVAEKAGVPVLPAVVFYSRNFMAGVEQKIAEIEEKIPYPVIIKPANLGSSVGIKIAKNRDELKDAVDHAILFTDYVMAERAVTALKEVNISVLGDAVSNETSECEEPVAGEGGFLSYSDKYMSSSGKTSGKTGLKNQSSISQSMSKTGDMNGGKSSGMASLQRKIPAEITPSQLEKIREYAKKTFSALGASGVARLDFIIDKDEKSTDGGIYFNEINTIPGSLSFYLWNPQSDFKNKLKYSELLDRLISLSLKREHDEEAINFSFTGNILAGYPKL